MSWLRRTRIPRPPPPPPWLAKKKENHLSFRPVEIFLILLALLFLTGSIGIYLSKIPLRRLILGWEEEEGSVQVGKLAKHQGILLRQFQSSTEFKPITRGTALFNYDTLMTSSEGGATIRLLDGGQIELGPDTLVRLQFESLLSGLPSTQKVEVISGTVSGQSGDSQIILKNRGQELKVSREKPVELKVTKTPTTSTPGASPETETIEQPVATVIPEFKIISPTQGATLQLKELVDPPQLVVPFEWSSTVAEAPVEIVISKRDTTGTSPEEISRQILTTQGSRSTTQLALRQPGQYEWEVLDPKGRPMKNGRVRASFELARTILGIEGLEAYVDGRPLSELNNYQPEIGSSSPLTFLWKPLQGISQYTFSISKSRDFRSPILTREKISESSVRFKAGEFLGKRAYYRVQAALPSGFIVESPVKSLTFEFSAPTPVSPAPGETLALSRLEGIEKQVLLTWNKVNLATKYEISLSTEASFKKPMVHVGVTENFLLLKNPKAGHFWWKVRSISGNRPSAWSKATDFKITP